MNEHLFKFKQAPITLKRTKAVEQLESAGEPNFEIKTVLIADLVGSTEAKDEYGHSNRSLRLIWDKALLK